MTTTPTAPATAGSTREAPLRVAVIVGSTRQGRAGKPIADWFTDQTRDRPDIEVDLIDLADFELPASYAMEPTPDIEAFTARIDAADAFVVVTPEYNHSYPASLKAAIDYAHGEWNAKPVGFISYGGIAQGTRAVEHLRVVFAELHAATIRDQLAFDLSRSLGSDGRPKDGSGAEQAAKAVLDQLTWWGHALRDARNQHPYGS